MCTWGKTVAASSDQSVPDCCLEHDLALDHCLQDLRIADRLDGDREEIAVEHNEIGQLAGFD